MSAEPKYTEWDMVLAKRAAFSNGAETILRCINSRSPKPSLQEALEKQMAFTVDSLRAALGATSEAAYPTPKEMSNVVWYRPSAFVAPDLLVQPSEEVDADA